MEAIRSSRARAGVALALTLAAMAAGACSSDAIGAPTREARLVVAAQLDAALRASTGSRAGLLNLALNFLGQGSPVDTVTIVSNGRPSTFAAVAAYFVQPVNGVPNDSLYEIVAWQGTPVDTVYDFFMHVKAGVNFFGLTAEGASTPEDSIAQVAATRPNGSCAALHTHVPLDVQLIPNLSCQAETVAATLSAQMTTSDGSVLTVALPQQSLRGVRLVADPGEQIEFTDGVRPERRSP